MVIDTVTYKEHKYLYSWFSLMPLGTMGNDAKSYYNCMRNAGNYMKFHLRTLGLFADTKSIENKNCAETSKQANKQ